MLKKIILQNYKSFKERTEINITGTGYEILSDTNKTENNILKGLLFVGLNASGKSNILSSILFLLDILCHQSDINFFDKLSFYREKNESLKLEYYFDIDKTQIRYIIECNVNGIEKEILYENDKTIVNRIGSSAEFYDEKNKKILIDNLDSKQSSVRKIYFDTKFIDNKYLKKWYEFLNNSIFINPWNKTISMLEPSSNKYYRKYFDEKGTEEFNNILKEINYNQIVEYSTQCKLNDMMFKFGAEDNPNMKEVLIQKENSKIKIPLRYESEGNINLINLLPLIIKIINEPGMLIIDEFCSCFHNLLEERIIKYFMKNSINSQIFLVSHSTNLLTNTLLRPDQIYSVDLLEDASSRLVRFSDAKPREAQNLEKMYLSGVFDGI